LSKLAPDLAVVSLPSLVAAMPRNSTGMTGSPPGRPAAAVGY
jgi:hypothetical protein